MDCLRRVLGQRGGALVTLLVHQVGFDLDTAERFVAVAGQDLMESYRWVEDDLDLAYLPTRPNVLRLLRSMHGSGIAAALGVPTSDAWDGLRAFVPRVLELADQEAVVTNDREAVLTNAVVRSA